MQGPVAGVRDDARDVGRHLLGREAICGGRVFNVEAERERMHWVSGATGGRAPSDRCARRVAGLRGRELGVLEGRVIVERERVWDGRRGATDSLSRGRRSASWLSAVRRNLVRLPSAPVSSYSSPVARAARTSCSVAARSLVKMCCRSPCSSSRRPGR